MQHKYLYTFITTLIFFAISIYPIAINANNISSLSFGAAPTGRYAENSVLSSGRWVKIQVAESGIHKITYEQLVNMGFSSPQNVRIYGYGGAMLSENFSNPYIDDLPPVDIYMENGSDNVFSAGDYILFYAQGPISWTYDKTAKIYKHTINSYSHYGYYFVSCDNGVAPAISTKNTAAASANDTITTYHDHYLHETDRINAISSGKIYLNEEFNANKLTHTFNVNIPNVVVGSDGKIQVNAAHNATSDQTLEVKVNNNTLDNFKLPACTGNYKLTKVDNKATFAQQSDNIKVSLTYSSSQNLAYLDYFVLETQRKLIKQPQANLPFSYTYKIGQTNSTYTFCVDNAGSNVKVWDITDKTKVKALSTNQIGNKLTFTDKVFNYTEYIAFDTKADTYPTPTVVGTIANQNLHASSQVDMVIISHTDFIPEAQRLAQAHTQIDGLSVLVVDAKSVYNEFSSGTPDATAYRRFMKMFYDRATSADLAPKYLLLFGDGSFDNRQILKANTDKEIYRLLTYQSSESYSETSSYTSDDYFCFLDDADGRLIVAEDMDIAVGRIPAYTISQAKAVVDKTIRYMQNDDLGAWTNQGIFLADDGDNNIHVVSADTICNLTQSLNPSFLTRKLYFDSYKQEATASGASYPILKKEFQDYIHSGVLMINYMGHGGFSGWADERMLTLEEIDDMYNQRLALWITGTCNFSRFDHFLESAGEKLLTHANGGAVALISTARTVLARENELLLLELSKEILRQDRSNVGQINTIGEALRLAKNQRAKKGDSNRMSYFILGDPAIRLNYSTSHQVVVDTINGNDINEQIDTIGALSFTTIKGYVANKMANAHLVDKSFNGIVEIKVFDKLQQFNTLCNDADSKPFTYTYRSSPIFTGKTSVVNGRFELQFIVPKDIKYNFGTGSIILYAADPTQGYAGNGNCENVVIGGENTNIQWETDGPDIQLYLNSTKFVNGDKVNENPLFVANIADLSGINTIGTGFGHDIILKLDNDPKQEYILNSYYESVMNSFTQGRIQYQLSGLTPGKHSLYFRVWDMQNNSSSAELQFEVVEGLAPSVDNLYVYPNPVKDIAHIVIENDRPNQPAEINVFIYNFAGQMVWTNYGNYVTSADNRITIPWNTNDSSIGINDGLYLVKAVIVDTNGKKDKKTAKILVRKQ